jgi:hypothetical protein
MRAMMSDQDARGGNGAGTLLQFTRAQQALDEATRLLARTEPIPDGCQVANRMYRGSLLPQGRFAGAIPLAVDALAEALATFVGEGN